jgi:hypothetical protein
LRIGRDVEILGAEFIIDRVRALVARRLQRRQRVRKPFPTPLPVKPLRPNRTLLPVGVCRGKEADGIGRRGLCRHDGEKQGSPKREQQCVLCAYAARGRAPLKGFSFAILISCFYVIAENQPERTPPVVHHNVDHDRQNRGAVLIAIYGAVPSCAAVVR